MWLKALPLPDWTHIDQEFAQQQQEKRAAEEQQVGCQETVARRLLPWLLLGYRAACVCACSADTCRMASSVRVA